ncbi:MAG: FG-GAP-like repeat-containing protein [Planctomycetota bacterium]
MTRFPAGARGAAFLLLLGAAIVLLLPYFRMGERELSPEALRLHHQGVALIDQHDFVAAEKVLARLTRLAPDDPVPWINLAISQLNQAEKGTERALASLERARGLDPENPAVPFLMAQLHRFSGDEGVALGELRRAMELAPGDADIHYQLGISLLRTGRRDEALPHFEMAAIGNPAIEGAWHNLQLLYRRAGRTEDANRALREFEILKASGRGLARSQKYTEQGRLAEAIRRWRPGGIAAQAAEIPLRFAEPVSLLEGGGGGAPPFAFIDFDLDCIPSLFAGGADPAAWDLEVDPPRRIGELEALRGAAGFAAGDFDEDGVVDLIASTAEGVTIHRGDGQAMPELARAQHLAEMAGAVVRLADIDLEGDLDLLAAPSAGGGSVEVALNEGRAFRAFEEEPHLLPEEPRGAGLPRELLLVRDLDGDGDAELLLGEVAADGAAGGLHLVDNAPQWRFTVDPPGRDLGDLATMEVRALAAADLDGDGDEDLVVAAEPGDGEENAAPLTLHLNDGAGGFPESRAIECSLPEIRALHVADLDLDGLGDILLSGGAATRILRGLGDGRFTELDLVLPAAAAFATADADGDLDGDLVIGTAAGEVIFLRNLTGGPGHALRLYLGGVRAQSDRRPNLLGIGARVELRAGDLLVAASFDGGSGHRAQGFAPLVLGIGPRPRADSLRILWPDGVMQAEVEIPLDTCHTVKEVQRKSSSCPILFAWDGGSYRFITDFMGGGGLGLWIGLDEYGPPDPTEVVRIEPGALAAIDGELRLSVMEPMQEVCAIDRLALIAVDHPAGTAAYADERFAIEGPPATGAVLAIDESRMRFPVAARGHDGADVRGLLLDSDRRYPDGWRLDADLVGYAEPHSLEISFGEALPRDANLRLFLEGWVEYPYSRINFAAWQGGRRLEAPTIHWRRDARDGWHLLGREIGYPAGMPKTMALDIRGAVAAGARELRIDTNMEIYWDRIFAAPVLPGASVVKRAVPLKGAALRFGGYPRELSDDGRLPATYHYALRDPHLPYRAIKGRLTRYGEVGELVTAADDRFAILGGGDELLLRFDATALPPLPAGRRRTFLLDTLGYCKDMDPLTAEPDSVEPLPYAGMVTYPPPAGAREPERREYRRAWNTRRD